jgi:hypothetical protein
MAKTALVPTVWPLCTLGLITEGAPKSGSAVVVKWVVWLAAATPASLVTPLMAIAITVLEGSGACGIMMVRL